MPIPPSQSNLLDSSEYVVERPTRSVLIVRIPSKPFRGRRLPDATFTFRAGEPQFEVWEKRYFEQQRRLNDPSAPSEY